MYYSIKKKKKKSFILSFRETICLIEFENCGEFIAIIYNQLKLKLFYIYNFSCEIHKTVYKCMTS